MIRLAFCGASGTGKSTLAQHVAESFNVPLNPIGSRSVSKAMGYASPYDVDAAGQRAEFQRRLLANKVLWERTHDAFVTDRTPFDNLAYTIIHDVRAVDECMLQSVLIGAERYTHIVFCPVDQFCSLDGDGARVLDLTYQRLYEVVLGGLFTHFWGDEKTDRVLRLTTIDLDSRKREVDDFIADGLGG